MSIAALVVGIIGIVMPFAVPAIVALVLGYVSKGHIDRSGGMQGGRGFAIAGIVLGWIGVALGLVVIGIYAWFFTYAFNNPEFFDYYRTLQTPRLP
jgi:TM2 domain-containing membrane protein YozV